MTDPALGQTRSRGSYFTQQNPVNGQNSFHSQGSFCYNVKMIKRGFWFLLRRGGNLPPVESAMPFSLIFPHNVRIIIHLFTLTYYFLLQPLPPAKIRSIFLYFSAFTRDIIAAKPRAKS